MITTGGNHWWGGKVPMDKGEKEVIIGWQPTRFCPIRLRALGLVALWSHGEPKRSPVPEEKHNLTILSIAPLIARAIREVFDEGSVTEIFRAH